MSEQMNRAALPQEIEFKYLVSTLRKISGNYSNDPECTPEWRAAQMLEDFSAEVSDLRKDQARLEGHIDAMESQRPHWAKGYSSDSVAAQTNAAALSQLWRLLGVENQSEAVSKLRDLVYSNQQPASPSAHTGYVPDEDRWPVKPPGDE